uniref:Uncharacterized protein n=1 Tax=Strigamia maritima TaxID=126957 RepID=T1IUW1_STRMM
MEIAFGISPSGSLVCREWRPKWPQSQRNHKAKTKIFLSYSNSMSTCWLGMKNVKILLLWLRYVYCSYEMSTVVVWNCFVKEQLQAWPFSFVNNGTHIFGLRIECIGKIYDQLCDLGLSFFSLYKANNETLATLTTLKRTPGMSPTACPLRPNPATKTSSATERIGLPSGAQMSFFEIFIVPTLFTTVITMFPGSSQTSRFTYTKKEKKRVEKNGHVVVK